MNRRAYIGGSDAAAILGVSKWRTPLECYLDKTVGRPDRAERELRMEKVFRRGKRLEPIVIDMLIEEYGVEVTRRSSPESPNRHTDPAHDFLRAEIDFEFRVTEALLEAAPEVLDESLLGTVQNGEIKTAHPFAAREYGEAGTDEVPIDYAAQSMHGLMVTGRDVCLYGVLFGADNLTLYRVQRDAETIAAMRRKELEFWHNHVLAGVPPEPVNMEDITRLFARRNGRPVEIDDDALQAVHDLRRLRAQRSALNDAEEELEFRIAQRVCRAWGVEQPDAVVDDAVLLYQGQPVATWKKQRGAYLDQRALKAAHPELIQQYTREKWFRVLKPKKSKEAV